ncbi:hypothetical protein [Candidatus Methanarcanum hacksteinii]|uniref:hypothetical protein n=1 Tax=Candidatus Methanarcanum hacksteinii TaxID=2911857 RepID=UPI0037DDDE58
MNFLRETFSLCEPFIDSKGENAVCLVPKNSIHPVVKKTADLDKADMELLKLISLDAWPLPGNFTTDKTKTEAVKLDLREIIQDCAAMVENYLRKHISFVDEYYYHICSLFVISTYFGEISDIFPRLIITGDTQSGKSKLQTIMKDLCYRCVKIGNGSFSSSFRTIDLYSTTAIFEEAQDYTGPERKMLMNLFKEGFERGNKITRCNLNSLEPEFFESYSPMIISTKKTNILDEDVVNRSFLIKMIRTSDPKFVKQKRDAKETDAIRTALYHMKYVFTVQRTYFDIHPEEKTFDLISFISESVRMLTEDDVEVQESPDSQIEHIKFPDLMNRELDIAFALYPYARIVGHSAALFTLLLKSKVNNVRKMTISDNGKVFNVWMELASEICPRPKTKDQYLTAALRVSTRDMRDRYVKNAMEEGNIICDSDNIRTQDLRFPVEDMGFELEYGKSTNGKTFVVPNTSFKFLFESNMRIYCNSDRYSEYLALPDDGEKASVRELAVRGVIS